MSSGDMLDVSSSRCSCISRRCDAASVFAKICYHCMRWKETKEKENEEEKKTSHSHCDANKTLY